MAAPPKLGWRARAGTGRKIVAALVLAAAAALFVIDPARHALYPVCWLYATTGWQCPGCGGTRAVHQLLHGHLAAAWGLNPLAVLLAPLLAWLGADAVLVLLGGRGLLPRTTPRPIFLWLGLAVVALFGVVRNLPLH